VERTAIQDLGIVKETAPAFRDQALALIEDQKFEEALDKISHAVTLVPNEAEYHGLRGNIFQSLLRIKEARDAYAQALKCPVAANPPVAAIADRGGSPGAGSATPPTGNLVAENLKLCEKILADNTKKKQGGTASTPSALMQSSLQELLSAMQSQGRETEAVALMQKVGSTKEQVYAL